MKLSEITNKTTAELTLLVTTSRAELATAVIDSKTKEVSDTHKQGRLKKTIARALTIIREREIAKEEQAS